MSTNQRFSSVVLMDGKPYILTTEEAADSTAKLCAYRYAETQFNGETLVVSWEETAAVEAPKVAPGRRAAERKVIVDWNQEKRTAQVSLYTREADGIIYAGLSQTKLHAEFTACDVKQFISPAKVNAWFAERERAKQEALAAKAAAEAAALAASKAQAQTEAVAAPETETAVFEEQKPADFSMEEYAQ